MMEQSIRMGRYRHYKGREYQVLGMAMHSKTEEQMVVCRQLYGNLGMLVCPASVWNEIVDVSGIEVRRFEYIGNCTPPRIGELWDSGAEASWALAYLHYYELLGNRALEDELENLSADEVKQLDGEWFYRFLYEKYFPWKYTANNRLVRNRKLLTEFYNERGCDGFSQIHSRLFENDRHSDSEMFRLLRPIKGLGTAGISGLLAILWPEEYGTVDQFVVKALRQVESLSVEERSRLEAMNPDNIRPVDAALLLGIMRKKAGRLNLDFHTDFWTPRAVDMVLWSAR